MFSYQSYSDASSANPPLVSTLSNAVKFGADHTNIASGRGRKSVRLESTASYTRGVFVLDVAHMPGSGCGAWPAYWTYGPSWPTNGEIDIFEGVNFMTTDQYTLHSLGPQGTCNINSQSQNGSLVSTNCAVEDGSGNYVNTAGCSITSGSSNSLMDNFNSIGGGIQVMQWTSDYIKMWFFPRNKPIPASLQTTTTMPDVCQFGRPDAVFNGCSFNQYFAQHSIVFSNTFCGDWGAYACASFELYS